LQTAIRQQGYQHRSRKKLKSKKGVLLLTLSHAFPADTWTSRAFPDKPRNIAGVKLRSIMHATSTLDLTRSQDKKAEKDCALMWAGWTPSLLAMMVEV
jgi:hypothetical protein